MHLLRITQCQYHQIQSIKLSSCINWNHLNKIFVKIISNQMSWMLHVMTTNSVSITSRIIEVCIETQNSLWDPDACFIQSLTAVISFKKDNGISFDKKQYTSIPRLQEGCQSLTRWTYKPSVIWTSDSKDICVLCWY